MLFAVLIVSNCKSAREAGMKCLVFFLISQPIITSWSCPCLDGTRRCTITCAFGCQFLCSHSRAEQSLSLPKAECVGCDNSRYRQYHCCPDGSKLFSEIVQCVPSALADGHFVCVNHCRSYLGMQKRRKTRILSAATTVLLTAGVIIWAVLNERVI